MSLRARMLGFLLLGGLLPVAAIAWFVFWYIEVRLYDQLELKLSISAEELRDDVDRDLFEHYKGLKRLAEDPALLAPPAGAAEGLLETASREGPYLCLAILEPGGAVRRRSGRCDGAGELPADAAERTPSLSPVREAGDGVPVVDAFVPLRAPGAGARWLRATLDLRPLSDMLTRARRTGGLDEDAAIYTADRRLVARRGGPISASVAAEFPVLAALDRAPAASGRGAASRGRPAVAAVNTLVGLSPPLDALKWRVAVVQPLDDASEPTVLLLRQLRKGILLVAFIALLTSLACSVVLFRGVMRPLNRLTDATVRVRDGDLTTEIEVERLDELGRLALFFNEMLRKLKLSRDQLTALATTDGLTGLANRRAFDQRFGEELRRVSRYGRPLSLALLDVDKFKDCNDLHGHAFGDEVLRRIAAACPKCCRDTDFVARYGGEELALILPETPKKDAAAVLERVRRAIEELELRDSSGRAARVTVSIGVANCPDDAADEAALLARADAALYAAKKAGRNRVALA